MLYTAPGLSEYISGVILHQETLFQSDAKGNKMVDLITGNGMIPGLKVDKGYDKAGQRPARPRGDVVQGHRRPREALRGGVRAGRALRQVAQRPPD